MKSDKTISVDARAIDVGYFSTKFTLGYKHANSKDVGICTGMIPSLAPRLPAGISAQSVLGNKTDGCVVEIADESYFVGRDAILYSSGNEPREVLDNYSLTDKYLALTRGAMHSMFVDSGAKDELIIQNLVVGLPINNFAKFHAPLTSRMTGEHLLPHPTDNGAMRRVTVEKTTVMVQPQGALISHKFQDPTALQNSWILVIDPGGGTLDWYVARGRSPNWQRSGAYPKSMLACSYAVADRIDPTWRDNFEIIERIDKAIRDGDAFFTTAGNKYQMSDYSVTIDKVLEESTNKMVSKLGSLTNLDMIVVAGGGANVFAKYFGARYPNLKNIISVHSDPVYANVKGFHLVGELAADSAKR